MNPLKKINLLLLIILLSSNFVFSQEKTDEERLKLLDDIVTKVMKDWNVPGMGLAIVKNGKIIHAKGYGYRDVEGKLPVNENTIFAIGSCTKAFTALDNCILNSKGLISLDKPVINYMPTFKMYNDYVTMNMSARDLLTHRSGLPRHELMWYGSDFTRQELFDRLRFLEPSKPFRTTFQYQNLMYMTAGHLVEEVTNQSWEDFTKENILAPLEMNSTNFSFYESQATSNYAKPYKEEELNVLKLTEFRDMKAIGPAGSINSNILDMSNWLMLHLNNGRFNGKKIVDEEMMQETRAPFIIIPGPSTAELSYTNYALGWMVCQYRGHLRVQHGGNVDGFSADACFFPNDSIGIVILTNMENTLMPGILRNIVADKLMDLSFIDWNERLLPIRTPHPETNETNSDEKDPNQVQNTEPSHPLKDYVGQYNNEGYGTLKIELNGDNLLLNFHAVKINLAHYHYDYFNSTNKDIPSMLVNFSLDSKGNVEKISAQLEQGVKDIVFTRVPDFSNATYKLSEYAGEYEMQGQIIKVAEKNNVLTLSLPGQPLYELIPAGGNNYDIKGLRGYTVTFNVERGKVNEIQFNQPNGVFKAQKKNF